MTEFWEVDGARGWDGFRDVVAVLVVEGVLVMDFSLTDVLRLILVLGAIQTISKGCKDAMILKDM